MLRSDTRARGRQASPLGLVRVAHRVPYRPPYAWTELVRFLAARAIPGVEHVSDQGYSRTIEIGGAPGWFEARNAPGRCRIDVTLWVPLGVTLPEAALQRIDRIFDVSVDPAAIASHFAEDPLLGPRTRHLPGLRVPGAWELFELGIRAILGQQVTVKGASTLAGRLVSLCGRAVATGRAGLSHVFPRAADVATADLSALGVPTRRRESLRAFAAACASGAVSPDRRDLPDALLALPGFGDWTVQYVLMRACGDPDAFPASDLWLRRSAGAATVRALTARADAWRPFRAYAAMYLWHPPLDDRGRAETDR